MVRKDTFRKAKGIFLSGERHPFVVQLIKENEEKSKLLQIN